jgi:glycosyltransferase involved in cell wall biosynthesis
MTEVVSHEVNGLLVPSRDQSAIATAVIRLAQDAGLRGALAERGRVDVMARYDSKQIAKRVEELYLETLDRVSS